MVDYYDDTITNIKPNADVYLDDRGKKFTTWADYQRGF